MAGTTAEDEPVGMPTGSSGVGPGVTPGPAPAAPAAAHEHAGQLWLIRHGETGWSKARLHTGRTDVPLTEYGEAQARGLRPMLRGLRPALVLASPRQRARHTAELAGLGEQAPIEICADLAEWDYGEYEGRTTPEIRADRPGWTIWDGDPPGGETAAQVGARADAVLARVRPALAAGPVVVVAHGHLGRVLTARWLGLDPTGGRLFALEPAAPCVLDVEHDLPVVFRWNLPVPAEMAAAGTG
jgi:probable phosphoglycerate mutase